MGATLQQDRTNEPQTESPFAQAIRESAVRCRRRALGRDGLRYVEAFIRLEIGKGDERAFAANANVPLWMDHFVGRAIAAMDAVTVAECEALAVRYGV